MTRLSNIILYLYQQLNRENVESEIQVDTSFRMKYRRIRQIVRATCGMCEAKCKWPCKSKYREITKIEVNISSV